MTKVKKVRPYVSEEVAANLTEKIIKESWDAIYTHLNSHKPDLANKLGAAPTIIWKKFGFSACGRTWWEHGFGRIEMNINFLYSKDAREFIESTCKHELAHLICLRLFKELKHNENFRTIARFLGDDGKRLATYAMPDNKPQRNKIQIQCACGQIHTVTKRKFSNIKLGAYLCKLCKRNLKNAVLVK